MSGNFVESKQRQGKTAVKMGRHIIDLESTGQSSQFVCISRTTATNAPSSITIFIPSKRLLIDYAKLGRFLRKSNEKQRLQL